MTYLQNGDLSHKKRWLCGNHLPKACFAKAMREAPQIIGFPSKFLAPAPCTVHFWGQPLPSPFRKPPLPSPRAPRGAEAQPFASCGAFDKASGRHALHFAVGAESMEALELLLDHGAQALWRGRGGGWRVGWVGWVMVGLAGGKALCLRGGVGWGQGWGAVCSLPESVGVVEPRVVKL